jgi:hypothetical protein
MRSADEDWYSRPSEGVLARLDQLAPLGKGLDLVARNSRASGLASRLATRAQ